VKIAKTVLEPLLSLNKHLRGGAFGRKYSYDELPLRSELLSSDQMKQHGKTLANVHKLTSARVSEQLLARLNENEDVLIETCNQLTAVAKDNSPIAPAEEWLLDNFYLIEEHIRMAKRHLPKGYSRGLPRLQNGPSAGLPRVYDIALETISHGDGRVDLESLISFVTAYQTVTDLKLGELWAIPIMLRLALIENLRRIGTRIIAGITDRERADYWADQMADIARRDPKGLVLVIADMARSDQPMVSSFVAEFSRRLQGQSPALALPLTWIEQRLSESHLTIEQLVRSENQQQAADQVSVSNSIVSLRFLTAMNWREFVETMSVVEKVLREDPSDIYIKMDFTTRDSYRHVVEKIAKNSPISESEVARKAINLSREGSSKSSNDDRVTHVGFYLIGKGLQELEQWAQMRQPLSEFIRRIISRFPLLIYLGTIMVITLIIACGLLLKVQTDSFHGWILVPIAIIFILGASSLAVALTSWLATLLAHPHPLPRMDFSLEIPSESSTLVVIPTMLTSAQNVEDLVEALEIRFLANQDNNLHFGLLTDFSDAHEETTSEDDALLRSAQKRIEELNDKYRGVKGGGFFLFHRPRRFNPEEQLWMGYERKRGKIAELNALLRGGAKDCFSLIVGITEILSNVKYVITLDTDTQLPRDSAQQFVGAMAHPLNRPCYDEAQQRICDGYGILQPRIAESLSGDSESWYARLWGGETGIDPYTRVVSNIYQDVFGEGSYIGKGIYDVDAFEKALGGRLPENRILSHDLIEGCYARSGLLSDVQLYEEYPSQYSMDVSRRHRWIRGDWQIASWLRSTVPTAGGRQQKNKISWISQWKIFDNLRRSLVPAALTMMLIMGWTIMSPVWLWTITVIGILLIPSTGEILLELLRKPGDVLLRQHFVTALRQTGRHFFQTLYTLVCLPYEAFFSLDAIARTLWRMFVTHKRLLEWNPSSNQTSHSSNSFAASCRSMWIAPLLSLVLFIYLLMSRPGALSAALFILVLWFLSPGITWWVSRPIIRGGVKLKDGQIIFLRKIARKTWAFFETFVGPDDKWLPPDNYQEHPVAVISHRTSPTNMGLALLANLSAYDFGYISAGELIERTANAFQTMGKMDRYRGHFYNWYDTQSLATLRPHYISTVDSGNLSGYLLTLRWGFIDLPDQKIWGSQLFKGISDTTTCLMEVAGVPAPKQLAGFQKYLASLSDPSKMMLKPLRQCLDHLAKSSIDLAGAFDANTESHTMRWVKALVHQCADALEEMTFFCPWITLKYPSARINEFFETMEIPTLRKLTIFEMELPQVIENIIGINTTAEEAAWSADFRRMVKEGSQRAGERIAAINRLVAQANDFADMDYSFLYDKGRHLLTVGYSTSERRQDRSYYDLLASEARFCSFIGIAQGQLPQENWFALGRLLTNPGRYPVLLSWDGSMFEYLMPLLVMPNYENTLLDQTYTAAVCRQIDYGKSRRVPWGISESGYSTIDGHLNYQYRAFGVPGLGLKRGLFDDLVIAPYASALALMVAPEEACLNLQQLARDGMEGPYGFYEAIDYTSSRLPHGQSSVVVRSFMAHHEGMSLLALAYILLDRPMQKRFESDPMFQSTMLLLQERIPRAVAFYRQIAEDTTIRKATLSQKVPERIFKTPNTPVPEVQLLSNGRYHVMITNAGGGYSRFQDMAVTRWREDSTRDNWGTFCYIRDVISGEFWSTAYQPTLKQPERYEAIFSDAKVEFRRRDNEINTHTQIAVSPEDDIELRRIRITNRSRRLREIDITSYAEIVLAVPAADELHPAFSNLFVQTEIIRERQTILCTRRPRSKGESSHWMFHLMALHGTESKEVSYETDRLKFIGRGNTSANPQAMNWFADISETLSDTEGSVLDPIVSIRCRVKLDAGESVTIDIVSGISETRDKALGLAEKYHDHRLADRVFNLARTHSQVVLRQINATEADAQLYGRLAGSIIYGNSSLRADPKIIIKNRRGQSGLWGYAISGDLPIALLQIGDHANIELVRQLEQAHAYWRLKGLAVDLVIWNEDNAVYRQFLHDQIKGMITAGTEAKIIDKPGGIFVRPGDQMSNEDRILLQTVARIVIKDNRGTLVEQISRRSLIEAVVPRFKPTRSQRAEIQKTKEITSPNLNFFNGLGGFTPDGREYVIMTKLGSVTPAPWVNVLANPHFGSVISESGSASTWSENAHEFRLTPWYNDPVSDMSGEAFYIRDEETGHFWSPMPLPCRAATPYISRHGFGYSVFEHTEEGIRSELWIYVAIDAPIKFTVLKLRNESGRSRSLSVTGYVEWVLGDLRSKTMMHVTTEVDTRSGALFARNQYNTEFADRVVFFDVDDKNRIITGDRTEFIGRNGELSNPAAMTRTQLSGKVGATLDPCAAIQVNFELDDGQEHETIFRLGVTGRRGADDASKTVKSFRGSTIAQSVLDAVQKYWHKTLGTIQVETPDQSLNVLTNGWLLYQTLSCRLWARNGYYQSGGAFGFRDQLQDTMALVYAEPVLVRQHLLLCASRQFQDGDVQHWWHPPSGRGVRTQCSDDYLWLPLAVSRYIITTGDLSILDEIVRFVEGRPVRADEDSYYDLPGVADEATSLYEHCARAIKKGLRFGSHGLPLMGSGDWNDGMNKVGEGGKGESVWMGFFLYEVLTQFAEIARMKSDLSFAELCKKEADQLQQSIERDGWDGQWYRRAYFDDGSPLGSVTNTECQIDSIAQSWSVLSGAGAPERMRQAMEAVDKLLVHRDQKLIQLLDPPFDKCEMEPGYIKGYVPGVRENGGQYTHAAIWAAMAFAALRDNQRLWDLLSIINPINHARSPEEADVYKVEPYVVASDVYALFPHIGRGGWTWFTGSAAWMYRLILESLLGMSINMDKMSFKPCLPVDWEEFKIRYLFRETVYQITVRQTNDSVEEASVTIDGFVRKDRTIQLVNDHQEHLVEVKIPVASMEKSMSRSG
jgi:cyclic beta-1,2-glucan synthetase